MMPAEGQKRKNKNLVMTYKTRNIAYLFKVKNN